MDGGFRFAQPTLRSYKRRSQREDIKHSRIADLLQLRRVDELRPRRRAQARRDGEVLLAVDLERHRRRTEASADVDLPQLVQRGVVVGSDGAVEESQEDEPAGGRERTRIVRVAQVHALLYVAGQR